MLLDLFCSQCGAQILQYRKEGGGGLVRIFLDRIISVKSPTIRKRKTGEILTCLECGNRIGMAMLYAGNRPAYRLIKGSYRKKKRC